MATVQVEDGDAEVAVGGEERPEGMREWAWELYKCVWLSLKIVLLSLVGVAGGVGFLVMDKYRGHLGLCSEVEKSLMVDYLNNASVVVLEENTNAGRFASLVGITIVHYSPLILVHFVFFCSYVKVENLKLRYAVLSHVILLALIYLLVIFFGMMWLRVLGAVSLLWLWVPILRMSLPNDSTLHLYFLIPSFLLVGGFVWIQLLRFIPLHSSFTNLVKFLMVYPFIREFCRAFMTWFFWALLANGTICGTGMEPRRIFAWVFPFWLASFPALYFRLQIANLRNGYMAAGVIIFQAMFEIFLRTSMRLRDSIYKLVNQRLGSRLVSITPSNLNRHITPLERKSTVLIDFWTRKFTTRAVFAGDGHTPRASAATKAVNNRFSRSKIETQFYSTFIVFEMLAEYVGIIIAPIPLFIWRDEVLRMELEWFIGAPNLFRETPDLSFLFLQAAGSLLIEICVDTFCIYYERKSEGCDFDLMLRWLVGPRFHILVFLTSWGVTVFGMAFVSSSSSLNNCIGQEMCHCVNNGLQIGGVREMYCKNLYPPLGLPP